MMRSVRGREGWTWKDLRSGKTYGAERQRMRDIDGRCEPTESEFLQHTKF